MEITRESIYENSININLDWCRPCTPNTKDNITKQIDCVEFEINHKGIEKLEQQIKNDDEFIMCFVHINAGTETPDGVYMSVWDADRNVETKILSDTEKQLLIDFAIQELRECR